MPFGVVDKSGLFEIRCNVLAPDRRLSLGGGAGLLLGELTDRGRMGSFSTGGGGIGDAGESSMIPSGRRGSSGRTSWAAKH